MFPSQKRVNIVKRSQPNGVQPKMMERKLKSGVNCQGAVKTKGRKTNLR